jgi:predicted RNase H-like nuclease (RuvC/YqgF family)
MELSTNLVCLCNGRLYSSKATLNAHRKTQCHQFWENKKERKDALEKINRVEIENERLKRENEELKRTIEDLWKRIEKLHRKDINS